MSEPRQTFITGKKLTVEWAKTRWGKMPALDFFESLTVADQAKVLALLRRFADTGRIINQQQFKKIESGLFEFKKFQIRLLGDYRPGQRFILALGLKKKKNRLNRTDLEKASNILFENDLREADLRQLRRRSR